MKRNVIALLWGIAEATVFFIVPDVWLSVLARRDFKKGILGSMYCLVGALVGGTLMYVLGACYFDTMVQVVDHVPAVTTSMVRYVGNQMGTSGVWAILTGPIQGIPYKIYAIHCHKAGVKYLPFLLVSIPARGIRFVAVTAIFHYGLRLLERLKIKHHPITVVLGVWFFFYTVYFVLHFN